MEAHEIAGTGLPMKFTIPLGHESQLNFLYFVLGIELWLFAHWKGTIISQNSIGFQSISLSRRFNLFLEIYKCFASSINSPLLSIWNWSVSPSVIPRPGRHHQSRSIRRLILSSWSHSWPNTCNSIPCLDQKLKKKKPFNQCSHL